MSRLLLMMAVVMLYACSDDVPADKKSQRHNVEVELRPYAAWFQEEPISSRTRAFPEDYKDANNKEYKKYADLYGESGNFKYQTNLTNATINLYFTNEGTGTYNNSSDKFGRIYYSTINRRWGSSVNIQSGSDYYLYGFIPEEVVEEGSSITENTNYNQGAILTLTKLSTITPNDVCVVVAAGRGDDETGPNAGYAIGQFKYEPDLLGRNFVYLLFDHLYASMRFNFKVVHTYDQLRTIKLKKLQLQSAGMKKYVNATITLTANTTGESPISSLEFSNGSYENLGDDDGTLFDNSEEPVVLTTAASSFLGCFLPGSGNEFTLKSTYDVYDKAGNLIRQDCKASNLIKLSDLSSSPSLGRGKMLAIDLTVNPTYLYMLSEPDLDNPTITIN